MIFPTKAAVLALLPSLALASPANRVLARNAGASPGSNMCDNSTFNPGEPLEIRPANVADCQNLLKTLDKNGSFSVSHSWARPYSSGDCAFSVRVIAGSKNGLVGGADATDLIRDSITKFQKSGHVASKGVYKQTVSAEGEVNCNTQATGGTQVRVEWIVASSAYNPKN